MSFIRTSKVGKSVGIDKYSDNPYAKSWIENKTYLNFRENGEINTDFKIHGSDYKYELGKYNVSMRTGITNGSNIVALDIDCYKWNDYDNHPFIKEFGSNFIELFDTYTQSTAGGGYHLFFQYHPDIGHSVNNEALEIDLKANKGSIVMAGSYNYKKKGYYKCIRNTTVKPAPQKLIDFIKTKLYNNKTKKKLDYSIIKNQIIDIIKPNYKWKITFDEWKKIIDLLPDDYYKGQKRINFKSFSYDNWLFLATANKILGFYDYTLKLDTAYNGKEDINKFNAWWNALDITVNAVEIIFNSAGLINIIDLYRYKPLPENEMKPNRNINIDKLSKVETIDFTKNIIIRSDTGTGKTTLIKKALKEYDNKFISIVSRVSLADEQYKEFYKEGIQCNHYKDLQFLEGMNVIIQVDSLLKLKRVKDWSKYVIFIDEINSFINHVISSTTISNRIDIFELLLKMLIYCKSFVMVDADVSDLVFKLLSMIDKPYEFLQNDYHHNKGIEVIEMNDEIKLLDMIKKEDKYLVCCDSINKAQYIYKYLDDKEIVLITSEDKLPKDVNFADINKVIISPSVIYGLDSNKKRNVYAFYSGNSINSDAFKQQIARERQIEKLYFMMTQKTIKNSKYSTLKHVEEDIENDAKFCQMIFPNGDYDYDLDCKYRELYSYITYKNDCFETNKRIHFINLLENVGFVVKENREKKSIISPKDIKIGKIERFNENWEEGKYIEMCEKYFPNIEDKELLKELFRDKKLGEVFLLLRYMKEANYTKFFDNNLSEIIQNRIELNNTMFNNQKITSNYSKLFHIEKLKLLVDIKINEKGFISYTNELNAEQKEEFKVIIKSVFKKKPEKYGDLSGYNMKCLIYNMITTVFPSLYSPKKVKVNKVNYWEYKYNENNNVEKLVKMLTELNYVEKFIEIVG